MIKRILISIFILFSFVFTKAQLVVNTGLMTPTQYVQNILVGSGVTVSNVTFSGDFNQIGEFDATGTTPYLGLTNGIILSTGDVNVALGPNNSGSEELGGGNFGLGDSDLDILEGSGIGTNDAAILEFDFIPTGDTVKFKYVFGSEEYPEYVNSINDVFGFFLSGPGVVGGFSGGAANIALIPGTTTPISINSVNENVNSSYYFDNTPFTSAQTIQFDGYTTVLTAVSAVQCGELYHIKIAIADASDTSWDSGVFLEAGSFSSNTVTLSSNVDVANGDSLLYEGCGTAFIDFVRSDDTDTSIFYYNIYGSVTGADYSVSADSIVFLPGEDTLTLSFNAINDGIAEPYEQVNVELIQTICGITDTSVITFYIADYPQFNLVVSDTSISCLSDSVPVWVDPIAGVNILWETGETSDTIWVSPTLTTHYSVTASDTCGIYSVTDSAEVTYIDPSPIITTTPDSLGKYCPQDSLILYASAIGGAGIGGFTFDWMPLGVQSDSLAVSPDSTQMYYVLATDVCGNTATDSVKVFVPNFDSLFVEILTLDTTICSGLTVNVAGQISGGVGSYYSWSNGITNALSIDATPLTTTTYFITAEDSCGSYQQDSIVITVDVSGIDVDIPDESINCFNEIVVLSATVSNNIGPVTYDWSTGEITDTIVVSPLVNSTYWVEIQDLCKTIVDTILVSVPPFDSLDVINTGTLMIACPGDLAVLSAIVKGGDTAAQFFNWSDGLSTYVGNNINVYPNSTTVYSFVVTDTCALMTDSISVTVALPSYPPFSIQVTNDTLVCRGDEIKIGVEAQGGAGHYIYDWKGLGTTDSITVKVNELSTYDVVVYDRCNNYLTANITLDEMHPTANFNYEYLSDYTVEFHDSSFTDIVYHLWTFEFQDTSNALNPIYTYLTQGEQTVSLFVRDITGCTDEITKTIKPDIYFYVPNAFTPNIDGINDVFFIKGMGIDQFEIYIFNRWGNEIFYSDDIEISWDGSYKGEFVKNDTYVYLIKAINFDGEEIEQRGIVNVMR
ncbi:T9SS type B sorting domain-containing protein [Vicingus serpentipes]|uniref:T9SS type B sorting domain-containing protein n=2 Tax=Vicingus serpentipes TaxID=1926625 RepID=A0A5C6RN99_9FLAO|nr:T9SS type B sorting domain-containing protein [Vicingus serpentipes]